MEPTVTGPSAARCFPRLSFLCAAGLQTSASHKDFRRCGARTLEKFNRDALEEPGNRPRPENALELDSLVGWNSRSEGGRNALTSERSRVNSKNTSGRACRA